MSGDPTELLQSLMGGLGAADREQVRGVLERQWSLPRSELTATGRRRPRPRAAARHAVTAGAPEGRHLPGGAALR